MLLHVVLRLGSEAVICRFLHSLLRVLWKNYELVQMDQLRSYGTRIRSLLLMSRVSLLVLGAFNSIVDEEEESLCLF